MPNACFWFNDKASDAFTIYSEALPGAEVTLDNGFLLELTMGDSVLAGMNGGPTYRPNKTISVFVELPTPTAVEQAYELLTDGGGEVYMELAENAWSPAYAWIADRWGVNWQLMCIDNCTPTLSPALLFTGKQAGRAAEAMRFWGKIFAPSEVLTIAHYPPDAEPDAGNIMHAQQRIGDGKFVFCDSSAKHDAAFTPGASLVVSCDTQAEIDRYWKTLSANGGQQGRCGWLTDRFGVSWQIIPRELAGWMSNPRTGPKVGERLQRMTKLIIDDLKPRK